MDYYYDNFLAHHGVKGMKWGVRKQREAVRSAKRERRQAYKEARKATSRYIVQSPETMRKASRLVNKANASDMKLVSEKAKLAKMKKGEKGEFNTYVREMGKSGAPGSIKDAQSGGRSTAIYNDLKKKKGKKYAEQAFEKTKSRAITSAAVGVSAAVGAAIVIGLMS